MQQVRILPVGDSAILIEFEQKISPEIHRKIMSTLQLIREQHIEGITDITPTYCALLINYDPEVVSYQNMKKRLNSLTKLEILSSTEIRTVVDIPVCYGGSFGPDLQSIANHAGLSPNEVIEIHSSMEYLIYMLGFLPGFTYLGGLDPRIHTPRLANPRLRIPAGSVGIGGAQTGIYPLESPGGWRLMGMTPIKTYDPNREHPILFEAGQYIRFVPITEEEYHHIKEQVDQGSYSCTVRKEV